MSGRGHVRATDGIQCRLQQWGWLSGVIGPAGDEPSHRRTFGIVVDPCMGSFMSKESWTIEGLLAVFANKRASIGLRISDSVNHIGPSSNHGLGPYGICVSVRRGQCNCFGQRISGLGTSHQLPTGARLCGTPLQSLLQNVTKSILRNRKAG